MGHLNVEIKADLHHPGKISSIENILMNELSAKYQGTDHQIDTYFNTVNGRLKLREGNIENNLIFYERENKKGPKTSNIILSKNEPGSKLKEILTASLGVLAVVDKHRQIYWIDNVKFHLDTVKGLGHFLEIEAIDYKNILGKAKLLEQCQKYMRLFNVKETDLISTSYSDMVLK